MMRGYPIVDAKISMPPPNRWAPDRAAARAALDRGQQVGVTVVASGPGYFKRQLVESWARLDPDRRVAWLALDEADDPVRLLSHAVASVRTVVPDFDPGIVIEELGGTGNWQATAADTYIEALGELTEPLVIVFDGVHRPADPSSRRGIEALIRYRPEQVRIVALTRDDAAINLASARISGSVVELREPELSLDVDQTFRMLKAAGIDATMGDAVALHGATEGWPAGVALAASRHDGDHGLVPFAPEEEPVQSYLRNRVLDAMDPDEAEFFLQVASLGAVHADLAAHVTHRNDAGRALDRLSELHLLFDRPGSRAGWRTFPSYLQRFAHHELRGRNDADARALCRQAATWCWERELLDESLTIASCGEDMELMARILLEHHLSWSAGGEPDRVRRWCSMLLQHDPGLLEAHLASAWASLSLGDDAAAASTVALLDSHRIGGDRRLLIDGELAVIRAQLARRRGEMDTSLAFAREGAAAAARLGGDVSTGYRGALPNGMALHVGMAALWAGELREAIAQLEDARSAWGWASQALPVIHSYLAIAHWLLDESAALAHADLALTHIREDPLGSGDFAALCMGLLLGTGEVGDEAVARIHALGEVIDEPITRVLAATSEAMHLAASDPSSAKAAVRRARDAAIACPEPGVLQTLVAKVAFHVGADRDVALGEPLTDGEQRVLRMLGGPLTEREIATELHLSHNTVRTYRRRLYRKLGLRSRTEVAQAINALGPIREH